MGGYIDKLQKAAGGVLRPGEEVLAAIRAMPKGTVVGMGVGGLAGAAIAGRQAKKAKEGQVEGSMAKSWPEGRGAVGLTNERLLTFNYSAMGKPKDMTAEFPLEQISSLDVKKGLTNQVTFGFSDGSAMTVECAKLEKVGDFEQAFAQAKGYG